MESKIVVLVGPIDYWWNENWHTESHFDYMSWREEVNKALVEAGHLVYRPHEAFKGAWDERAQAVNLTALNIADIVINLNPGVPAYGTADELKYVEALNETYADKIQVFSAPPRDYTQIAHLLRPLDDPYSDVHRKSYTRWDEQSTPTDLPGYEWEDDKERQEA